MERVHKVLVMSLLEMLISDIDNTSSSHTDNQRNNILVLGEGSFDGINCSTGAVEKISFNFSKANTTFCWNLHVNSNGSYLFVNKTKICKFKVKDNIRSICQTID